MTQEYLKNNMFLLILLIICIWYGGMLYENFGSVLGLLLGAVIMTLSMIITELIMILKDTKDEQIN